VSKLTDLIKQHGLATIQYGTWTKLEKTDWPAKRDSLVKAYGNKVKCDEPNYGSYNGYNSYYSTSANITCNEKCNHYLYMCVEGFAYSWPGQNYLISKTPISTDVFHELIKAKTEELALARKKRFETIKSPRDAVRLIFRDLDSKVNMVQGNPRIACGPFDLEFKASKDDSDPKVTVSFVYREYYVKEQLLTTLSIADPNFSKKVEALVSNGKNLSKLMLGEVQPKLVNP
jgi:hypothetical protein